MPTITMYTKDYCPYCVKAKTLLKRKGVESSITEIDITRDEKLQQEMLAKSNGKRTVPQIFIGETHVGGCDDLYALDAAGKLDPLLK
ncbi:MAG: glutaredoxin 3 [Alphaproteobacteria bacterium]|nr:glutaredoxin 3 [Alphaproteobacteria bacterium]